MLKKDLRENRIAYDGWNFISSGFKNIARLLLLISEDALSRIFNHTVAGTPQKMGLKT